MKTVLSGRYLASAWCVVVLGTAWIAANVGAEVVRIWNPIGTWNQTVDYDGVISEKAPCITITQPAGQPAKIADLTKTKPSSERARIVAGAPLVDEVSSLYVGKDTQPTTRIATIEHPCLAKRITHAVRCAGAALTAGLAVLLFWRRKNWGSFGFFLFSLGFSPMAQTALTAYASPSFATIETLLNDITEGAGLYGLMMFCEEFGRAVVPAARYVIGALAVLGAGLSAFADIVLLLSGAQVGSYWNAGQGLITFGIALALIMIFWAYRHSDEHTRAQGKWILAGSLIGITAYLLVYVMDNVEQFPLRLPDYDRDLLYLGPAVVAGAVVYAELRHHVMNIGFFFSMGLFYTALTGLVFAALTFGTSWARQFTYLAVLSAVCFQPFRKVMEQFVREHLLKRRAARLRDLRERTRTIGDASTLDDATSIFVTVACDALNLHGAAIVEAGRVVASAGRYATMNTGLIALASDRALRDELDDHDDAIRLPYERYGIKGQFRDSIYPRVAIIVDVPRKPYRIFVASPHSDGMDIDGDEVESLRAYARRATVALAFLAMCP